MAQLNRGWMVVGVITLLLVLLVAIAIGIAFTNQNLATGALPPYTQCNGITNVLSNGLAADGYCAFVWSENVDEPRAILTLDNGDVIVLERGSSQISIHWDDDGNGISDKSENAVLVSGISGLNHAVRYHNGYLYASKDTTVFRWPYSGDRSPINATAQVVVQLIPSGGHHTRPVEFDQSGRIYVNLGSAENVDTDTTRSVIKRFNLTEIPEDGHTWASGEIFASGMRNEVGLRIDANGYFWGVENGIDKLVVNGKDIHNDNPCEELNAFGYPDVVPAGTFFYGYPYCWSEYIWADGEGEGTQWVHPSFSSSYSNDWCQNSSNVQRPALCLPAHVAPLDILFYYPSSANNSLTSSLLKHGDAFVTMHGSWNRDTPQGYRVVRVSFNLTNPADNFVNSPTWPVDFVPFLYYAGETPYIDYPNEQTGGGWIRPVGLAVSSKCGMAKDSECLLVSSDDTRNIVAVMKKAAAV